MNSQHYLLTNSTVRNEAVEAVRSTICDGKTEVIVRPANVSCSDAQHRLKWLWVSVVAEHRGDTKEHENRLFKWHRCRPILLRDDQEGGFTYLYNGIMKIEFADPERQRLAWRQFTDMIHTKSMLDVPQMREALTEYDNFWGREGLPLPRREDIYYLAMGENK